MDKSADAFRTISEVSELLDVPAHVLRFWETRFPQIRPVKRAGGRRYFRPADIALLGGIKRLLHEDGMTIRGVQKLLKEQGVQHVMSQSTIVIGAGAQISAGETTLMSDQPQTPEAGATPQGAATVGQDNAGIAEATPTAIAPAPDAPTPDAPALTAPAADALQGEADDAADESPAPHPPRRASVTPLPRRARLPSGDWRQGSLFSPGDDEAPMAVDVIEPDAPPPAAEIVPFAPPLPAVPPPSAPLPSAPLSSASLPSAPPASGGSASTPGGRLSRMAGLLAHAPFAEGAREGLSAVEKVRLLALRDRAAALAERLAAPPDAARR